MQYNFYKLSSFKLLKKEISQVKEKKPISSNIFQLEIFFSFKPNLFKFSNSLGLGMLFFEILTQQKPKLFFSKKNNALYNLRKGSLVSFYARLNQKNSENFFKKWLFCYLPITKPFLKSVGTYPKKIALEITNFQFFIEVDKELNFFQKNKINFKHFNLVVVLTPKSNLKNYKIP